MQFLYAVNMKLARTRLVLRRGAMSLLKVYYFEIMPEIGAEVFIRKPIEPSPVTISAEPVV